MLPTDRLSVLPPELLLQILSQLPVASLLSFGLTSHLNHHFHYYALHTLHLAAFPKRIHSLLSFLDSSTPYPSLHHVATTTRPTIRSSSISPASLHKITVKSQNEILTSILPHRGCHLQTLTFHAHDLLPSTALALAKHASQVQNLTLSFFHPHARPCNLPRSLIEEPSPPSPMWNALAGIGPNSPNGLRNLQRLSLIRVSITSFQLLTLVSHNDRLHSLHLRKCPGVDEEFLNWLGTESSQRKKLRVLELDECDHVSILTAEEAAWIHGLSGLETLSLANCPSVDAELTTALNSSDWRIRNFIPPLNLGSPAASSETALEVDPEYNNGSGEESEKLQEEYVFWRLAMRTLVTGPLWM